MLPSIKVTLPIIMVLWCVGGVMALGPEILAYPVLWAAVAGLFLLVDMLLGGPRVSNSSSGSSGSKGE
ncbi:hypothetical protein Mal64_28610 [Pseudobythopirellula maris]|uniref:Uncharacterized protein n=1 Tax=Pseudobythopirellula maris TaxID=2527991 RepID=A0A5C5ZLJ7_9BACT|nr:hypothetical protein Mal64_28610 [Pseudobythopirellula maris]